MAPQKEEDIQPALNEIILSHQHALTLLRETQDAYNRLVPHQLLSLLQAKNIADIKPGDQVEVKMAILFSDIRNFTSLSESMTLAENFGFINSYLSQMESVISRHHGIIDKYIGDAIMALFVDGADEAVNSAIDMLNRLDYYNGWRDHLGYQHVQIGIGINTGMVMIGTVGGFNRMDSTVIGDAVNIAARMEEVTKTYNTPLLISHNTLYDLNDPDAYHLRFLDRIRVRGKSQPISIYEVFDNDAAALRQMKFSTREDFERGVAYYHLKDIDAAQSSFLRCIELCPDDIPARIYLQRCLEYQATQQHCGTGEMDTPLLWKEAFKTGIERIDGANQILLQHINRLATLVRQNDPVEFDGFFTLLRQHCEETFPLEESMMRDCNYPFADIHAKEHNHFMMNLERTKKLEGSFDSRCLAYRTALLLLDWFADHAVKRDRHFARFMQIEARL